MGFWGNSDIASSKKIFEFHISTKSTLNSINYTPLHLINPVRTTNVFFFCKCVFIEERFYVQLYA